MWITYINIRIAFTSQKQSNVNRTFFRWMIIIWKEHFENIFAEFLGKLRTTSTFKYHYHWFLRQYFGDHFDQCIVHDIRLYEKLYEIHSLLYKLHVIRRCHYYMSYTENRFSAILRRLPHNGLKKFQEIIKFWWWISNEMHPNMIIDYTVFGKGAITVSFFEAINTFR